MENDFRSDEEYNEDDDQLTLISMLLSENSLAEDWNSEEDEIYNN